MEGLGETGRMLHKVLLYIRWCYQHCFFPPLVLLKVLTLLLSICHLNTSSRWVVWVPLELNFLSDLSLFIRVYSHCWIYIWSLFLWYFLKLLQFIKPTLLLDIKLTLSYFKVISENKMKKKNYAILNVRISAFWKLTVNRVSTGGKGSLLLC